MIVGNIKDVKRYFAVNPNFEKAFEFLKTLNKDSEIGSFEFDGFKVNIMEIETSDVTEDKKLEAHRDYLDIHYVIAGAEAIGYADIDRLEPVTAYDKDGDYLLLKGDMYPVILNSRDFCIVFPEDAHTPCICAGDEKELKKAVVKILA